MVSITITEKGGSPQVRQFNQSEITVGRVQGNDIVLPKSNVSKRHLRIYREGAAWAVADANSTNGTYVNGKRLNGPQTLKSDDRIFVGDFTVQVRASAQVSSQAATPEPRAKATSVSQVDSRQSQTSNLSADDIAAPAKAHRSSASSQTSDLPMDDWDHGFADEYADHVEQKGKSSEKQAPTAIVAGSAAASEGLGSSEDASLPEEMGELVEKIHRRLRTKPANAVAGAALEPAVRQIVAEMQAEGLLPKEAKPELLIDCVLSEAAGFGPLQSLLEDPSISEILVNSARQIFVERAGKLELCDLVFSSDAAVMDVIQRIVTPLGRHIDHRSPMVDARLRDGSRVHAIVPPLAIKGPTLTIRKFSREPLQLDDLVAGGALNADMADFLETCVKARRSIVVSGGTSSGKTTLLNVLSSFIGPQERIITIEDAAELKLEQAHVVALESRPAAPDGTMAIGIRELVRNALRMRPDRILVGECRGQEALDMLQAMNTGHEGSMTTVHANGPRDALSRLETMVLMGGTDVPARAIRDQVASAIDIIVQQSRFPDGSRRITHISEITGMEGEIISMHDLFTFDQQGYGVDQRVQGRFHATGVIPKFYENLRARGIKVDLSIFRGV